MTIGLIVAPLTGGQRDALTLANAFALARPVKAHLRALFVRPDPTAALPYFGDEMAPAMAEEIVETARHAADHAAAAARQTLADAAAAIGWPFAERPASGPGVSFAELRGHFSDCVAEASQLADLTVFGPLGEGARPGLAEAFEATLLKTGSPVFLGSEPALEDLRHIALGWNASAASARAVGAALPYLTLAEKVTVLIVEAGTTPRIETEGLADYLAAHGIAAGVTRAEAQARPVGDVLLDAAMGEGAQMLVAGGYSHSRLREWFAGGVTRRILAQARLPLLLVH